MRTEELIHALAADARPVRPLAPPSIRLARGAGLVLPALLVVILAMGLRPDLAQRLAEPLFVFQLIACLLTAASAGLVALMLGQPGRHLFWLALPLVPFAAWIASLGRQCLLEWQAGGGPLLGLPHTHCLPDIAVMMAVPTAAMVVMVLRGAGLNRRLELAMGGLAAAALSNAALGLAHPEDAGLLVLLAQFVVVGLLAWGLGSLTPRRGGGKIFRR